MKHLFWLTRKILRKLKNTNTSEVFYHLVTEKTKKFKQEHLQYGDLSGRWANISWVISKSIWKRNWWIPVFYRFKHTEFHGNSNRKIGSRLQTYLFEKTMSKTMKLRLISRKGDSLISQKINQITSFCRVIGHWRNGRFCSINWIDCTLWCFQTQEYICVGNRLRKNYNQKRLKVKRQK